MLLTIEILKDARARISAPEKWLQGRSAGIRTESGMVIPAGSEDSPNCFCLTGAIDAAARGATGSSGDILHAKIDALMVVGHQFPLPARFPGNSVLLRGLVQGWNDDPERTHAEVLAALDKAIDYLEKAMRI